jgi:predicted NAD-dependent protein-ADP-ribosyltransferase YbiA (DUF1768 family)
MNGSLRHYGHEAVRVKGKMFNSAQCPIVFYNTSGEYGWLHNHFQCNITFQNKIWSSVQHLYEASKIKITNERHIENTRIAKNGFLAKKYVEKVIQGDNYRNLEFDKLSFMYKFLKLKFDRDIGCKNYYNFSYHSKLEATNQSRIIFYSPNDLFWECYFDGNNIIGENQLGNLLMQVRAENFKKLYVVR